MNKLALWTALIVLPSFAVPAQAQIFGFFGKKSAPRGPAVQRVPELIMTLKTDSDERRRSTAAAELGQFDAGTYAEITPVLIDALLSDSRPSVRMEAGSALGALRPTSQAAGNALDKSASSDDNWRVRIHSKGIAMKYRFAGITPGSKATSGPTKAIRTDEPPLLAPDSVVEVPAGSIPGGPMAVPQPAANPPAVESTTPQFRPAVPRPLPQGTSFNTSVPQRPAVAAPAPLPMAPEGPALDPVKTPF